MPIRIKHELCLLKKIEQSPSYVNELHTHEDTSKRKWLIHRKGHTNNITDILYYTITALQSGTPVCLKGARQGISDIRSNRYRYSEKRLPELEEKLASDIHQLSSLSRALYALDTLLIAERDRKFWSKTFWSGVSFMEEPCVPDIMKELNPEDKLVIPGETKEYSVAWAFDTLLSVFSCRGVRFQSILTELVFYICTKNIGVDTISELYDLERALASRNRCAIVSHKRRSLMLPLIPELRSRLKDKVEEIRNKTSKLKFVVS